MSVDRDLGPAQLVLMASVARRYYLADRSKMEIAEELGLSRFQVARLLDKARSSGLVHIEIGRPGAVDLETSGRLRETFGLSHAVVVDVSAAEAAPLRAALGAAAAGLLREVVTPADVLGVAWSRAVSATAAALSALPAVPVVQLTGSLSGRGIDESSVELVRRLAAVSRGPAYFFYAPMTVPDAATARALRRQPEVARTLERYAAVTKAVVGIGRWQSGQSTLYDATSPSDRRVLHDLGVRAELSGIFVAEDGSLVRAALTDRMIGVTADQLRAVPEVIGLPYGTQKAPAVRAALRSGLVTSLVTHRSLALALLDEA